MSDVLSEVQAAAVVEPPAEPKGPDPRIEGPRGAPAATVSAPATTLDQGETSSPAEGVTVTGGTPELANAVTEVLKTVFDPEIPVNIYELGLVYGFTFDEQQNLRVEMTLTSPACPVAGSLPPEIEQKLRTIPGIGIVQVEVVWFPPWTPAKMSEEAKLMLNLPY